MKVIGRAALVALFVAFGLIAGYAASLAFRTGAERVPAIDLDRLPAGDAPPFEAPPESGDIVVPPPTLAPAPTTVPAPSIAPAPPPAAPSPPPGDDDDSDDSPDDDGGDDGEFDDD